VPLRRYDPDTRKISDASGGLSLVTTTGEKATTWSLAGLMSHRKEKHARTVYVPSIMREASSRQCAYKPVVRLARLRS